MALPRIPLTTAALALVALVLAALIGRDVFFPPAANTGNRVRTATVVRGTVRSVVSGTGSLVPTTSMNVGFKTAGTLTEVDVKVGDRVTAGQVLGKIDAANLQIALDQANAQLASAQANLQSTLSGTSLAQAQHALDNARQSYGDTVSSVNLTNSQDAAQLSTDQGQFNVDNAQLAADQASPFYQNYVAAVQSYQTQIATDQATYYSQGCNPSNSATASCSTDYQKLATDQQRLQAEQNGTDSTRPNSAQEAAAYKQEQADQGRVTADNTKIAADQAKVNADQVGGQSRVNSAQNAITSAQDSLSQQTSQRPATIATQQAAVESAQGAVQTAQNNLNAATLTAPADGTITVQNGNVGDSVSASAGSSTPSSSSSSSSSASSAASSSFVQLSNLRTFQIVAPFAEADASRVQIGQTASVTFDAIQGLTEPAHVTLVAPTSTVTSNVVNYSVTFALDQTDPRLRSGMTSNLTVTVANATNVLLVPNSAITRIGTRAFVTVLDKDGKEVRTLVTPGVVGDTTTEITSGLQEGDKVVLPQLRTGTATTQAGGRGGFGGAGGGGGIRVGGGG